MTKKLFVVLVVVFAMLISFTLVMGAKQAIKVAPERYDKQVFSNKQQAVSMPAKAASLRRPLCLNNRDARRKVILAKLLLREPR